MLRRLQTKVLLLVTVLLGGCSGLPDGVTAVQPFDLNRYLGTWYEIARLDHSFERGLEQVSAEYQRRDDGTIAVTNRGYSVATQQWKEVHGSAKPAAAADVGMLKVTFFWPFSGAYNVIALSPDYDLALVSGANYDYLWILARTPKPNPQEVANLVERAKGYGFATEQLIWVRQIAP